jgi:hypothetical protein
MTPRAQDEVSELLSLENITGLRSGEAHSAREGAVHAASRSQPASRSWEHSMS